ncbi:MAG: tetratricopeptide repeat protein [Alphaproteobacteria bacterium]|nr:tetratricopeptide repeat protein [Alphaproteobacteria bacterium]
MTNLLSPLNCLILLAFVLAAAPAHAAQPGDKKEEEKAAAAPEEAVSAPMEDGSAGSYLSSRFARQSGDVDAAILYLARALEKNPDSVELAGQLLTMQVAKGDMASALFTAHRLQEKKTGNPLVSLLIAIDLVKKQDYARASTTLGEAFDTTNGQLWLPLVDAWIDAGKGKLKQALTIEEMPVSVGRAASIMNYHLALLNAYSGFTKDAALNFNEAIENPETAPLRVIQYIQSFNRKHPETKDLRDIVDKYEAARGKLIALESPIDNPADGIAEVLYTMGNVMQISGVHHDAMIYIQLARHLRPDFYLATFNLAEILSEDESYKRASDLLATIPVTSQYAFRAALKNAVILDHMGNTAEALDVLASLAANRPQSADPWIARGDVLRGQKRFLEASIAYSEAIARSGTPLAMKSWPLLYARGACFERLDRWSDAKADLQKALDLNPDQPDVLNYLGYGLLVRGEALADAKAMLEKAIALSPNDPQIIDSMGWALYIDGQYHEALPYLERAVELLPNDATVNDHLGDNYWRLGRKSEARFQWERALTFQPEAEEAKQINTKLVSGLPEIKAPDSAKKSTKSASAKPAESTLH